MKKAICPKDRRHRQFVALATVREEWTVNPFGEFNRPGSNGMVETIDEPDHDEIWYCHQCGAEALHTDECDDPGDLMTNDHLEQALAANGEESLDESLRQDDTLEAQMEGPPEVEV